MRDLTTDRESPPLDYSPSSTAIDESDARYDEHREVAVGRHDYTDNATFTDEEIPVTPDDRRWADDTDVVTPWRTLNDANRYYTDDEDGVRAKQHEQDAVNDCHSWGQRIGLTRLERERAAGIIRAAERGVRNEYGMETVVLAALTLAANEDDGVGIRSLRDNGIDVDTPESMTRAYEQFRQTLDTPSDTIRDCRNHLHDSM